MLSILFVIYEILIKMFLNIHLLSFTRNGYLTQASTFVMLERFRLSSKLLKKLVGHTRNVLSIDYSTFDNRHLLCSGSEDKTVCVWNLENNTQIRQFNGHSDFVYCVKFSPYHCNKYRRNVICSSSNDNTIRFWDIKSSRQLQVFKKHTFAVCGIEVSPFNGGRYLCSGSRDKTIRLWDVDTSKSLHVFNGHNWTVWCVDISPLQSNNKSGNDNDKSSHIGLIGGNGYTICSGSLDATIRIWDIETAKQLIVFKGHENNVRSVKYGSNKLKIIGGSNTILSGSADNSVRLWDIRSGRQIQAFNGHTNIVWAVEYSPLVVNNVDAGGSSAVICSGSWDSTIRFWDIRSNKNELYVVKRDYGQCDGVFCLKFVPLKKKVNNKRRELNSVNLCYGSSNYINVWG
ncbi:WD-40 repeat protein [Reticulomyxa filosa]|uniref:WD-40 repeat protein n=1 Tax=Reticulomyxa filosa TaxID=46433 RepID=X6MID7_RETFI|nr:WD-40 repeat protein [Reticulomyxa filosa]|eukprot:ETO13386.1 WD-40 repeat protein [Reticulomyxa filosa]